MALFEHVFMLRQDLSSTDLESAISNHEETIKELEGTIVYKENWGLKNLSHLVKNNRKAFYFHIKFTGFGKTIYELEKAENIDQMLISFLTVKVKKHDLDKEYFEKKDY